MCHSAYFYQPQAEKYYGQWNDVPFNATKLCDDYGVDTKAIDKIISWLESHFTAGLITEEQIGLPLSKIGSQVFIEALIRKIALREGSGDVLAQGLEAASEILLPSGVKPINTYGLLGEPGFFDPYGPRLYLMNGFLYAMEPTFPIAQLHEIGMIIAQWRTWKYGLSYLNTEMVREIARRFWGGEEAVDFSTDRGKAGAAMLIQNREYAKECLVVCDFIWPVRQLEFTEDHLGDPALESRLLSAVTGKDINEQDLYRIGERVFNLQRAILVREGRKGRESDKLDERCFTDPLEYDLSNPDCIVPGKGDEIISLKGNVVAREQWETLKDEYYDLRGWDVTTGLQTRKQLENLDLSEVADDLQKRGLVC
jgi:aldehyde:ferredoxin oxidoreductase